MMTVQRGRRAEGGMAVVAVMVLIALLFLTGTVMALAVSSSLHTIDTTSRQDAIHYAAESAVARGVAAVVQSAACRPRGSINKEVLLTWCQDAPSPAQTGDQDGNNQSGGVRRWAIPAQRLEAGACSSVSITSGSGGTAWTVVAWRGAGDVRVWTDSRSGCLPGGGSSCMQIPVSTNVLYATCVLPGSSWLHMDGGGAAVNLGSSVVRWAPTDADPVRTVVGTSGFEVDEADVVIPSDQSGVPPTQIFWNTVLP